MGLRVALVLLGAAALAGGAVVVLRGGAAARISAAGQEVVVHTSARTPVVLEYGLTRAYGLFAGPDAPAHVHRFALPELEPGRTYFVRAGEVESTVSAPPRPARAALQIAGDHILLDGRPWIPRFTWGSCSAQYAAETAAGVNAFMSSNCGDSPQTQAAAALRAGAVVIPAVDQADAELPTTIGTYVKDEPDARNIPPAQLASTALPYPAARGLPVFETLSPKLENAAAYTQVADSIGVDVYPIMNTGDHGRIVDVASAQRTLEQAAGGKPTFQWIEAIGGVSPRELAAEVWMAICNGARAFGYWTFGATPFAVDAPTIAALRNLGTTFDDLAPAIDAAPAQLAVSDPTVNAFATQLGGALYVFAVNTSPSSTASPSFTLTGLHGRPLGVYGTPRVIGSHGDGFADTLAALAWRVYVVAP